MHEAASGSSVDGGLLETRKWDSKWLFWADLIDEVVVRLVVKRSMPESKAGM